MSVFDDEFQRRDVRAPKPSKGGNKKQRAVTASVKAARKHTPKASNTELARRALERAAWERQQSEKK